MIMTTLQTQPEQTPNRKNWFLRHPVWTFTLVLVVAFVVLAGTAEPAPEPAVEPVAQQERDAPEPAPDSGDVCNENSGLYDPQACVDEMNARAAETDAEMGEIGIEDTADEPAPEPEPEPEPAETVAQQQAIISAENYLTMGGFSRSGLVDQLEYEGYDTADIEYAIDAVDANWRDQAVLSAENYMEMGGFSRASLIEQLEYEGFSTQHATNAADEVGL